MSAAANKQKNEAMAAYMKAHPGQFPDSVRRPWQGNGADVRKLASTMGKAPPSGKNDIGMLGGIIVARLGLGSFGIPDELLHDNRAA